MDATQLSPSRFNPPAPVFLPSELYPEPLDAEKHEIRLLLTLLPGAFHEPIQCTLAKICLKDTERPLYEALSYVWGDPKITKYVMVHGALFHVTINLESALRHLRDKNDPRTLWIDAICINQNVTDGREDKERHGQVRMMGQVYTSATRVIIWLGTGDQRVVNAIKTLQTAGKGSIDSASMLIAAPLYRITSLDWFNRVWTKQEMVLAVNDPIIIYGRCVIPWSLLTAVCQQFKAEVLRTHVGIKGVIAMKQLGMWRITGLDDLRTLYQSDRGLLLSQAILCSGYAKATNPRDMVYGVLGMRRVGHWTPQFPVDYGLPVSVVFAQAMAYLINVEGYMNVLIAQQQQLVCLSHPNPDLTNAPSWAIDFTAQYDTSRAAVFLPPPEFSVCGTRPIVSSMDVLKDLKTLSVKVMPMDVIEKVVRIEWCCDCPKSLPIIARLTQEAWDAPLVDVDRDLRRTLTRLRSSEPLWRLLVNDTAELNDNLRGSYSTAPQKYEAMFEDLLEACQAGGITGHVLGEYAQLLEGNIIDTAFFITKSGFVGTSARGVQAGDEVNVWLGVRGPFVTRPTNDGSGNCRLVSAAYVGGIMKGEMVDELFRTGMIAAKILLVR